MADCGGFAAVARAAVDLGERFLEDFGIGILHSGYGGVTPHHHRSPTSANKPAGQDSWALMRPGGLDDSTAPIPDECQSFRDNVVAGFGQIGAWNTRGINFLSRGGRINGVAQSCASVWRLICGRSS